MKKQRRMVKYLTIHSIEPTLITSSSEYGWEGVNAADDSGEALESRAQNPPLGHDPHVPAGSLDRTEAERAGDALPSALQAGDGREEVRHRHDLPQQDPRARADERRGETLQGGDLPPVSQRLLQGDRAVQQGAAPDQRSPDRDGPPPGPC